MIGGYFIKSQIIADEIIFNIITALSSATDYTNLMKLQASSIYINPVDEVEKPKQRVYTKQLTPKSQYVQPNLYNQNQRWNRSRESSGVNPKNQ